MIEGTRTFRRKSESSEAAPVAENSITPVSVNPPEAPQESRQTAALLDRREAMAAIGPSVARALVGFLRAANTLQHEVKSSLDQKSKK